MKKTLFLLLMLHFTSSGVLAATEEEGDRWYEVEILVFSHEADDATDNEVWPEVELPGSLAQSIILAPPDENVPRDGLVTPYQMLPDIELKLAAFDGRLARTGTLTPLFHGAWRQPAFPRGVSMPVGIQWEKVMEDDANEAPPDETSLLTPPQMPDEEGEPVGQAAPAESLRGTLTISVNRYLHVDVDLYYRPDGSTREEQGSFNLFDIFTMEEAPRVYRMHQARRMRSSELHYIDHPHFGLIVQVTPYEYPVREEEGEKGEVEL